MHEIILTTERRLRATLLPTNIVSDTSKFSTQTICTSYVLDKRLVRPESACMLSSVQSAFRDSSRIVPKVLMVTGGQGGYLPSEIQGLKGWRRRWIHSAITYI